MERVSSDAELLAAVVDDAPGAFDAFVDRYGRRLLAFGVRMCGHREDAEDVFQDTLLKAYQGLDKIRDPGAVRTWLYRVVSNQCLMKRRKKGVRKEISLEEFEPQTSSWRESAAIVDASSLPDETLTRAELQDALERSILELPPDYRIVVLLRDVEGLSTRETAETLGIGQPAVKMRLHRARLALREALAQYREQGEAA